MIEPTEEIAIVDRDLERIKVSINIHESGNGRFIARIAQDCECGWGSTTTLASWSSLRSLTKTALAHLAACRSNASAEHATPTP